MRIGIIDSGTGGLTVLKSLIDNHKYHDYIYVGDTKNFPYGNKTIKELIMYTDKIIEFLITKRCKTIILACGTLSINLSSYLREKYSHLNIIDIINPMLSYINQNNYKNIGIVGTNIMINTLNTKKINNINLITNSSSLLATLIEENQNTKIKASIKELLKPFENKKLDLFILGCTHYPIVIDYFKEYINTKILDLSTLIPKYIEDGSILNITIYFTSINNKDIKNINKLINSKYIVSKLELN